MSDRPVVIAGPGLPAPLGPYSPAVRAGNLLFVSGQAGIDPATGEAAGPSFSEQCQQSFRNIESLLVAGGSRRDLVVSATVLLADFAFAPELNELFGAFFTTNPPARMTLQTPLPGGIQISVGCVALVE